MKRFLSLALAAATLSACATRPASEPRIETVAVSMPTPVKCAPRVDLNPVYPDTDAALAKVRADAMEALAAPGADQAAIVGQAVFDGTKLLVAGHLMRSAHEAALKAALQECAG